MHRRNAMTLIALGTLVPATAFGQDRSRREARLDESEDRYIEDTLAIGGVALATSHLAQEKARHRWVKKFAEYETSEQEGVASILRSLGATQSSEAHEERRDAARDLRELSGERFDDAYLDLQAEGHDQLLRVHNDFIKKSREGELQIIAKLIRGRVQEHVDLIRTIREQLRA